MADKTSTASGMPRVGFRRGFAELLDLNATIPAIRVSSAQEITRAAFVRVGESLRSVMAKARDRHAA